MLKVVYRASPGQPTEQVVQLLRSHGLSPQTLDRSNPDTVLLYAAKGTYRVRIAVPDDQVTRALEILRQTEASEAAGVKRASSEFRRQLLLGYVVSTIALLLYFTASGAWRYAGPEMLVVAFLVGGVPGALLVAAIFHVTRQRRPQSRPSSPRQPRERQSLLRRVVLPLLSILVFDWSFQKPWRSALEENGKQNGQGPDRKRSARRRQRRVQGGEQKDGR